MDAVEAVVPGVGAAPACRALGLPRASLYRMRRTLDPDLEAPRLPRPAPPRALAPDERAAVLDTLHCERFMDHAPAQVHATLLDEGTYLCSPRTMYRILDSAQEVKERRDQVRRPHYAKPELLATRPNEVWSWDITKLMGPAKWTYFYLYVILDIFSRYVVGWMVAPYESAALAEGLISETCDKQRLVKGQLTLHADRGSSMKSKPVALLLADLGVVKTHSRPQVSNDNPFSESQFKTMKYRPGFPERFGSLEDARTFGHVFFPWYNEAHHHSALGFLTPAVVHYGLADGVRDLRQRPRRCLRSPPRAVREGDASARRSPPCRLDQPARKENDAPGCPRINANPRGRPEGRPDLPHSQPLGRFLDHLGPPPGATLNCVPSVSQSH